MPTVAELTTRAKTCENAGDAVGALAIYTDLLTHFEVDPDSIPHGPDLYTRVGDLRLQLGQPARAFASYQQAAELYAKEDSAEDVKKLCIRMINVVPAAGNVYARYARRLHELGHVDSALNVLAEYAAKAELGEVSEAVRAARGRPDTEKSSVALSLLDTIDRDKEGQAAAARRVSRELGHNPAARAQIAPPRVSPAREAPRPRESAVRPSPPAARTTRPPRWLYLSSAAVGVAGMVFIIVALREPAGSGTATSNPPTAVNPDSAPPDAPAVVSAQNPSPRRDTTITAPSPRTAPPVATTTVAAAAEAPVTAPQEAVTADPAARPIVVESLLIRSVAPVEFRGQQGFRVVHQLDSVGEFIVESYPVDSNTARAYPLGTVIINAVPPDTTVSIVRFDERHVVFASGVVSEERMRVLLGLLHVQPQ